MGARGKSTDPTPAGAPAASATGSPTDLALLAAIVESSDDAIISKTLNGRILTWNAGATRVFGYSPEEAIGQPITLIVPPELHEEERHILEQLRRGERLDHFETTRVTKDGRRIPISLSVSPVRDASGVIVAASKVARDISERKRVEQLQRDSERFLAAEAEALARLNDATQRLWRSHALQEGLNEMLAAALALLEADKGTLHMVNGRGAEAVLRIAVSRGFEHDFLERYRTVTATTASVCARALVSGKRVIVEDLAKEAGLEELAEQGRSAGFAAVTSTPLLGADGKPLAILSMHFPHPHRPSERQLRRLELYVLHASDFIQRCRMEQALRQNEEALLEADRRKDEFLALLAHELRNPLAPIRYALAATRKSGRTLEQRAQSEAIMERQVAIMARLLDDLLDVSRITRGTLELKKSNTDLGTVLAAAVETARPALNAKQHTLALDLPSQQLALDADPVRLAQVFSNLLINAAKYTDVGGRVELHARQHGDSAVIRVRDNGVGIAADMMPRLFMLFSQADSSSPRSEGGLGVGLALARGLVSLHGGQIEAHSDGPGQGSEFTVRMPLAAAGQEAAGGARVLAEGAKMLKVLIVDDSRDAADSCATLLKLCGHEVRTAYTGRRALEIAEEFAPDVALLDIGLPDISGYELARALRAAQWSTALHLVAVTGWGQDQDKRRALTAGFDRHLTKPIAPETLESLLQTLAAKSQAGLPVRSAPTPTRQHGNGRLS
jgi:PAS domain S-box-containing protein